MEYLETNRIIRNEKSHRMQLEKLILQTGVLPTYLSPEYIYLRTIYFFHESEKSCFFQISRPRSRNSIRY